MTPPSIAAPRPSTIQITSPFVIHNYRWRLGLAEGEPKFDALEKRLAAAPVITVPTITMEGDANGAPHPGAQRLRETNFPAHTSTGTSREGSAQPAAGSPTGVRPGCSWTWPGGDRRKRGQVRSPVLGPALARQKIRNSL